MTRSGPIHRRLAWLLVVALLVATLAPWSAVVRASGGAPGLHDVCLTDGSTGPGAPDAPTPPASGGHCPLCVLQAAPAAPPPSAAAVLRVPLDAAPRATDATVPPARGTVVPWDTSPPRAPPRLG
ncbi:MAG: hypothetical protein RJA99_2656 [Pseudomonadota bacterium]|jgi:hypothetical protein